MVLQETKRSGHIKALKKIEANHQVDLLHVPLAAKVGEGIKARETCNTW